MLDFWTNAVLPAAVGAVLLYIFFRQVESRWPSSYYSVDDLLSRAVSRSPWRYAAFRFGPVYVACLLVADQANSELFAVLLLLLFHVLATVARSIAQRVRGGRVAMQVVASHLLITAGIALSGSAALLSYPLWATLLPDRDKYVEGLFTAVVTTLLFFLISRLTTRSPEYPDGRTLLQAFPREQVDRVVASAAKHRVDRDLALTLLVAEDLQRPVWVRRLEYSAGRLGIAKTFGPLQGSRRASADDAEAIDEALARIAPATLVRAGGHFVPQPVLQYHLERHNSSEVFIELAEAIFGAVGNEVLANSEHVGADGSPGLRLLSKRRSGDRWLLMGDRSEELVALKGVTHRRGADDWKLIEVLNSPGRYRTLWSVTASIHDERLTIGGSRTAESQGVAMLEVYL